MNNTKSKKIIVFGLASFKPGGIEKQLIKQLQHFDRSVYSFHIITLFQYAGQPVLYDQLPEWVHVHKMLFKDGIDLKNAWRLLQVLRSIKPDLVVSSMVFPNTIFRMLKPLVGYKSIAREHNTYNDKTLRHKIRDHIFSYVSETIVAVSKTVARYASQQAHIPLRKFIVVHNGVDIDAIKRYRKTSEQKVKKLYAEFNLSSDSKIVLNVARLKPQKNHTLLIDAFAKFLENHPEYVLFIVGAGADEDKLHKKVNDMNLKKKIFLVGYREDVYTFYSASDFFVLTSDIEGFPNVGLEAMAFGLPLLSTKVSGVDEFLEEGKNGYFLERTVDDVCDKMEVVIKLEKNKLLLMQKNCRKTVVNFSIRKCVSEYELLFKSIL